MPKNRIRQTKISLKLPEKVDKGKIIGACSTVHNVVIEGYNGPITVITGAPKKEDGTFLACRGKDAKAWVQIRA